MLPKSTLAPNWKPVPVIVRVGVEPDAAVVGLIEVIVGGGGCVTVKLNAADVPAGAGSTTYTGTTPTPPTLKLGMVSCVELTKFVLQ